MQANVGRTPKFALLICLLVAIACGTSNAQDTMSHPATKAPQSDAQKAFEKLKTLAGTWQGSFMGMSINLTLRVTSSGNAILHEAISSRKDDPITIFYVEGDRLLGIHYCDSGNRPRMEGKMSADGKKIEFTLLDIAGHTHKGYMGNITFNFVDADRHVEEGAWTFPGDKPPIPIRVEYTRTK
jgi:hypothetical protein